MKGEAGTYKTPSRPKGRKEKSDQGGVVGIDATGDQEPRRDLRKEGNGIGLCFMEKATESLPREKTESTRTKGGRGVLK